MLVLHAVEGFVITSTLCADDMCVLDDKLRPCWRLPSDAGRGRQHKLHACVSISTVCMPSCLVSASELRCLSVYPFYLHLLSLVPVVAEREVQILSGEMLELFKCAPSEARNRAEYSLACLTLPGIFSIIIFTGSVVASLRLCVTYAQMRSCTLCLSLIHI